MASKSNQYLKAMGIEVWKLNDDPEEETPAADLLSEASPVAQDAEPESTPAPSRILEIGKMDADTLRTTVAECQRCQLSKTRTNTVFGSGSLEADVMFIGEGPGQEEDLQGLPFVGRAGRLLTAMIASLGFERDQVYISNVVKCRPPSNRDPLPDEASACSHYLRRQIEIINPKVIVALGRVSAQLLLDSELPLGRLRGTEQKYRDTEIDVVVTYHPAYLLRKPTEKRKSWEDLWGVKSMLNQQYLR